MPANFQDFSLDKMLETLINRFQHHPTIAFEFIAAGQSVKLDSTIELSIYRITNELITNILKYSKATTVTIQTVYQYDRMILSFEDDGQPFSLKNHLPIGDAIGVNSIMARLDFIQAKFSSTSDNNGNILIIDIPYTPHE
jgi:signal transduction histidine kinase